MPSKLFEIVIENLSKVITEKTDSFCKKKEREKCGKH